MLVQRRRRWANVSPTFGQHLVFAGVKIGIGTLRVNTLASVGPTLGEYLAPYLPAPAAEQTTCALGPAHGQTPDPGDEPCPSRHGRRGRARRRTAGSRGRPPGGDTGAGRLSPPLPATGGGGVTLSSPGRAASAAPADVAGSPC